MRAKLSIRRAFLASVLVFPVVAGCDMDNHATATGQPKKVGLTPGESGPNGSGSIATEKVNAGGPGAPGTTAANPEK